MILVKQGMNKGMFDTVKFLLDFLEQTTQTQTQTHTNTNTRKTMGQQEQPGEEQQEPLEYPQVSILYCIKCNWVLRASWYQQELLQTFTAKASTAEEAVIRSVTLTPSYVPGTFKVFVKRATGEGWVIVWDRKANGGFPEAKVLKQVIRNELSPETNLGHSDKSSTRGVLLSSLPGNRAGDTNDGTRVPSPREGVPITYVPSDSEVQSYGSPRLASEHKTFCEECIEHLPPTWEM